VSRRPAPLPDRLADLDRVLALGQDRIAADRLAAARAVREKADARLSRGDALVVAALVGGTGSGKSSLFNALADGDLAPVGVRRPTTETARAAAADGDGPEVGALLDWLEVPQRHAGVRALPESLVLLDVPDHDSVATAHHAVVDRLVERVDVLVWVVDPIKYAMRALHEGYLARLAAHAEVVVVVLNRVDELSAEDARACAADLRGLLDGEGLTAARLLPTSVRTGHGVPALRDLLREEAAARSAAARRLVGDVRSVAAELAPDVGDAEAGPLVVDDVVAALAGAAGVGGVAATAQDESRAAALEGMRPLLSRGGLAVARGGPELLRQVRDLLPLRSPGRPRAAAHADPVGVRHALAEAVDRCAAPLPPRWRSRLDEVAGSDAAGLARAVAGAVDRVPLRAPARWWWPAVAALLSAVELAAAVGAVWLLVLAVLGWLQLPAQEPPAAVGAVPLPTALLLGGLAVRVLGGALRRRLAAATAARHRRRVAADLLAAVREVAEARVLAPIRAELGARDELRALLVALRR
jgi:hypothetical protein